ncbi:hypothetical protein D3C81_1184600 [compost metagenome]
MPEQAIVVGGKQKWNSDFSIILQEGDLFSTVVVHYSVLMLPKTIYTLFRTDNKVLVDVIKSIAIVAIGSKRIGISLCLFQNGTIL